MRLLAAALAVPLTLSGCILQTVEPGRTTLTREEPRVSVAYERDAGRVWAHVKETLAHLSERQVRTDEATRTATATAVDEGVVEVRVEELAPGRSRLHVEARLFSSRSAALAARVLDQIDRQVERRRPDY